MCCLTVDVLGKSFAKPLPLGWCELQAFSSCIFLVDALAVLHRPYFERGAVMQLHRVRCKINEPAGRMLLNSLLGAVYQSPALPHIHPHHHQPLLQGGLRALTGTTEQVQTLQIIQMHKGPGDEWKLSTSEFFPSLFYNQTKAADIPRPFTEFRTKETWNLSLEIWHTPNWED